MSTCSASNPLYTETRKHPAAKPPQICTMVGTYITKNTASVMQHQKFFFDTKVHCVHRMCSSHPEQGLYHLMVGCYGWPEGFFPLCLPHAAGAAHRCAEPGPEQHAAWGGECNWHHVTHPHNLGGNSIYLLNQSLPKKPCAGNVDAQVTSTTSVPDY